MASTVPSPQNWSPIVDTLVTQQFLRVNWENTKRIRVVLEYLNKSGSITYDGEGAYVDWSARVGEFSPQYHVDLGTRQFKRLNHDVRYTIPWTFIETLGVLSENDIMFLQSPQALVNLTTKMLKRMSDDFYKDTNKKILQENATSFTVGAVAPTTNTNGVPMYGLPTLFGYGSQALSYSPVTQVVGGNAAATDTEIAPNTSYGNVSTHPTNAITGVDNKLNESTSPVLVNWSSTQWNTTAVSTWAVNAQDVLERCITRVSRSTGVDETPDFGLMPQQMYLQLKQNMRGGGGVQRHVVLVDDSPRQPDAGMYARRFIPFNGVNFFYDENMPASTVYVLNSKQMNFRIFPQKPAGFDNGPIGGDVMELFSVKQAPDIDQGAYKVVAKMAAQLIANPRYHAMAYTFA